MSLVDFPMALAEFSFKRIKRWSDVVPPNTALTFAVIWDPEDGIVAFSGADLFDGANNGTNLPDSTSDACDGQSQILTIGPSTIPLSENTATLAFFREHHDFLFTTHTPLTFDRFKVGRTQTSSTLEGFDVYLRGSMFASTCGRDRQYSFLGHLGDDFKFDPRTSFANMWMKQQTSDKDQCSVTDEGYAEEMSGDGHGVAAPDEPNLSSAFSVTTTSTSNYISVELNDVDEEGSATWSTLEAPNTPSYSRLLFSDQQRRSSGRLKKRKPASLDCPARPSEVLQRTSYNHTTASAPHSPCASKHKALPKFVRSLSIKRWRSESDKEPWVCVEVAPPA
ncbi:hypothetical protein LshimejAT787_1501850 [Lyophyllum shimeji]|uniref:Uncharacterized protein n=1 Tax=Lyophyllum shimeji TaxID=47721 RepID=A0A9P3PYK8_LYOSH|nr:hypothetical protein LshimejAT787_1501850 [Lyophyllum shimeji]